MHTTIVKKYRTPWIHEKKRLLPPFSQKDETAALGSG